MNRETHPSSPAARWIDALVRVLDPGSDICTETQLLTHFPFARTSETPAPRTVGLAAPLHGTH